MSMSKSKHHNWMVKVGDNQRIFRPITDGYDVLEFERYSYTEGHNNQSMEISTLYHQVDNPF